MTWERSRHGDGHSLHVITGLVPVIPLLRGAALQAIGFTGTTPAMTLGRCHYRACPGEPDRKTAERIVRTMRRFKV